MKKLLIAAVVLAASTSANANLIVNGSFENPTQANGTYTQVASIPGWVAIAGALGSTGAPLIEIRNNVAGVASDGFNYVELDSTNNSGMKQTIATTAGTYYDLVFDYAPRVGQAADTNNIQAFWGNTQLVDITGIGNTSNNWVTQTFRVLGTGGNVDLKFFAAGKSDSYGGNIDNVRLNAVPVPAAAWLFTSALGLFGFARRRSI